MLKTFILPTIVLILGTLAFALQIPYLYLIATIIGIGKIVIDSWENIREGNYSLDYVAFLAMLVGVISGEYLAATVVALMFTGGDALEEFAGRKAEKSLKSLLSRIPKNALVSTDSGDKEVPLKEVANGSVIIVKSNELIPLDGELVSENATLNEANLTGESLPETVSEGTFIKSGAINVGSLIKIKVSGTFETSTYARIVELVADAEKHQSPFVRMSAKANFPFTALTLLFAGTAYFLTEELSRALAVLVIATPCPLIIAAPVAFIGGLSRGARENIIFKRPVALEILSNATAIFFDKTGTLTLGQPALKEIKVLPDVQMSSDDVLSVASALEYHSLHPLAKAIINAGKEKNISMQKAESVEEELGKGIKGVVGGKTYSITKAPEEYRNEGGITLLVREGESPIATIHLEDVIKDDATTVLNQLIKEGYKITMITGDSKENAEALFGSRGIEILSNTSPENKYKAIDAAKARGEKTVMIGDGLNDAPALAHADVGIVFSGTENSASIEAAQIVILGHNVRSVKDAIDIAKRSTRIARESVWSGIVLSVAGMIFALFGFIVPVMGALIQEAIDIVVILNAVRAAFGKSNPDNLS